MLEYIRQIRLLWTAAPHEIRALNGLRAFAILAVYLFHVAVALDLPEPVAVVCSNLWSGVDLFFVLSGYLIYRILRGEYKKTGDIALGSFYLKRVLRIFPAYYFFLSWAFFQARAQLGEMPDPELLNGLARDYYEQLSARLPETFWDAVYLSNYVHGFHLHTWSLAIEEQFYLVFPWLVLLLSRSQPRARLLALVALYAAPGVLRGLHVMAEPVLAEEAQVEFVRFIGHAFHTRADALLAGVLVYELQDSGMRLLPAVRIAITALLAVPMLALAHYDLWMDSPFLLWALKFNFLNLGFAWMLYLAIEGAGLFSGLLSQRALVPIARLSYAMYLWHILLSGSAVGTALAAGQPPWMGALRGLGMTALAATLSYVFIESPFLVWKRRFQRESRQQAEAD